MHDKVQEYYGKVLQNSDDLQTDACCTEASMPDFLKPVLSEIHDEVMMRYYGCGLIAPEALEGLSILDLGSGSGRDAYALAKLVGENGRVVGVDMTDEQLEVANRHLEYHREKFGYAKSNVTFLKGYLENLGDLGLEEGSFDVIVSNCVINLCDDKEAVLKEAFRLLKPGGEMYFSDVYSDRRVPIELTKDPILHGECLSGALYWNDFLHIAKASGFADPRLVTDRPLGISNPAIAAKLGNINFYSATYRLFKLPDLEPMCEDYGQAVIYKGTVEHQSDAFALDGHHYMEKGRVFPVCGNTYRMLSETRFKEHFDFIGDWSTHYGIFPGCGTNIPFGESDPSASVSGGCC
ncbi:methyltransferase domain-containing protein [Kordiimonas sp. SCSIO 12610]|uniref:methyltransferase domain-containing protein n=1 Tax=Kordiimonas sp. SCSIO 12610 TaxID=2829597 RepID=UPI00210CDF27|nr:methyltransferase domain-containing protein [Kordiimonas sp. SCSIO 12610]UTW55912.1 methyltransferase domain-containing protein [Kordiimonas sp. SCSIO 12610]